MEVATPEPVDLYIYDLTNGLATVLSPVLLGTGEDALVIDEAGDKDSGSRIDGVWHTSVVVFGREYFYGGRGITSCTPGSTQLGQPQRVEHLGETYLSFSVFMDFMQELGTTTYTPEAYHLLRHNCNHFSEEAALLLCNAHVPKFVLTQALALPHPLRLALAAFLDDIAPHARQAVYARGSQQSRESPDYEQLNEQVERARYVRDSCDCGAPGQPASLLQAALLAALLLARRQASAQAQPRPPDPF